MVEYTSIHYNGEATVDLSGYTSIGNNAINNASSLTSVTIPSKCIPALAHGAFFQGAYRFRPR